MAPPDPLAERHTGEGSASALETLHRLERARDLGLRDEPPDGRPR